MNILVIGSLHLSSLSRYKIWTTDLSYNDCLDYWKFNLPEPIIYLFYPIKSISILHELEKFIQIDKGWCHIELKELIILIIDTISKLGTKNISEQKALLLAGILEDVENFMN